MNKKFGLFVFLWLLMSSAALLAQEEANLRYVHDAAGQLIGTVDANGQAKAYTYDAKGRLVSIEKLTPRGAVDVFFVDPASGERPAPPRAGTPVTIHGAGFGDSPDLNQVTFNGVTATVESATATGLKTRVPAGATTGPVRVVAPAGTATSRSDFVVTNACLVPPSGLVGWWPGHDNASDLSGSGNHGRLRGGVTFGPGRVGRGFRLNGINSAVEIPDSPSLRPTRITVEAWVKFDAVSSPVSQFIGLQVVWFKRNTSPTPGVGFLVQKAFFNWPTGTPRFQLVMNPGRGRPGDDLSTWATTPIEVGQFYHVAATYDGSTMRLYTNGVLEATRPVPFALDLGAQPAFIGSNGGFGTDPKLRGTVNEVSVYNRALSDAEIRAIYQAGAAGKCRP